MLKSQQFNKDELYPEDFTEEDKLNFDILFQQSLILFPKLKNDDWLAKHAVIAYIRKEKGQSFSISEEDINIVKEKYNDIVEIDNEVL